MCYSQGCFQSGCCGAGWFISDCCKIWKENKALRKRLCSKENWSLVWKMLVSPAGIWLQIKSFRNRSKGSLQKECQEMHLDRMSAPTFLKLLEQWATSFQCLIPAHRRRIMKKLKDSHLRHLEVDFFKSSNVNPSDNIRNSHSINIKWTKLINGLLLSIVLLSISSMEKPVKISFAFQ